MEARVTVVEKSVDEPVPLVADAVRVLLAFVSWVIAQGFVKAFAKEDSIGLIVIGRDVEEYVFLALWAHGTQVGSKQFFFTVGRDLRSASPKEFLSLLNVIEKIGSGVEFVEQESNRHFVKDMHEVFLGFRKSNDKWRMKVLLTLDSAVKAKRAQTLATVESKRSYPTAASNGDQMDSDRAMGRHGNW
jgi:hypothetical protein